MAMCPKCFNHNKSMLAQHCPDCTHMVSVPTQIKFSFFVTVITWIVIISILYSIFAN